MILNSPEVAASIAWATECIEILAVLIIIGGIVITTIRYTVTSVLSKTLSNEYTAYKNSLGRFLLLGLELLIAADIIKTVVLEPTTENMITLIILVLIRTFLTWSITVEIEGYWPWQNERNRVAKE